LGADALDVGTARASAPGTIESAVAPTAAAAELFTKSRLCMSVVRMCVAWMARSHRAADCWTARRSRSRRCLLTAHRWVLVLPAPKRPRRQGSPELPPLHPS